MAWSTQVSHNNATRSILPFTNQTDDVRNLAYGLSFLINPHNQLNCRDRGSITDPGLTILKNKPT